MKKVLLAAMLCLLTLPPVTSAEINKNGIINAPSDFSVPLTSQRLISLLKGKGMTIFARIQHSENAGAEGIRLRDTELIIFGNPKVGGALMKCQQQVALDLPMKLLIWEDELGRAWVSYNDPRYLEKRHDITGCEDIINKMEQVLASTALSASVR